MGKSSNSKKVPPSSSSSSSSAVGGGGGGKSSRATSGGCMSSVFHFFDLHLHHPPPSSFRLPLPLPSSRLTGTEAPRNSLEFESVLSSSEQDQDDKLHIPMGMRIKTTCDERRSTSVDLSSGVKTPTLVARLMGLDILPDSPSSIPTTKSHRSLPETPRVSSSSSRRSIDADHRLSLQINVTEALERSSKWQDENRSPREYARQIMKQVKESVTKRVGLADVTNTSVPQRRDQELLIKHLNSKKSSPKPVDQLSPANNSPRLRFFDSKNKPTKQNQSKKVSSPPQTSDIMRKNKQEEPFVRSSSTAIKRPTANIITDHNKTPLLSSRLLSPAKKDHSSLLTKIVLLQTQLLFFFYLLIFVVRIYFYKAMKPLPFSSFCSVLVSSYEKYCSFIVRDEETKKGRGGSSRRATTANKGRGNIHGHGSAATLIRKQRQKPTGLASIASCSEELDGCKGQSDLPGDPVAAPRFGTVSPMEEGCKSNQTGEIFICNLPPATKDTWIRNVFSVFGEIVESSVPFRPNRKGKYFGFVRFRSSEAALQAISSLNGLKINGSTLLVARARRRKGRFGTHAGITPQPVSSTGVQQTSSGPASRTSSTVKESPAPEFNGCRQSTSDNQGISNPSSPEISGFESQGKPRFVHQPSCNVDLLPNSESRVQLSTTAKLGHEGSASSVSIRAEGTRVAGLDQVELLGQDSNGPFVPAPIEVDQLVNGSPLSGPNHQVVGDDTNQETNLQRAYEEMTGSLENVIPLVDTTVPVVTTELSEQMMVNFDQAFPALTPEVVKKGKRNKKKKHSQIVSYTIQTRTQTQNDQEILEAQRRREIWRHFVNTGKMPD